MAQDPTTTAPAHRVFIYGDHRFDDPGAAYAVEQIQSHLGQYFPELAHATTEEKTLPDGTVEITFRKRVARKGSGDAGRLALLLDELKTVLPYEDPLANVIATVGDGPLSLAAILDVQDALRTRADHVFGLADRTSLIVRRCHELSPSPTRDVLLGF